MSGYPAVAGPDPAADPTLAALLAALQQRHRGAICCTLAYGSCLRSGDIYDGLLDLYLLCDSYRAAYPRRLPALANWLLPPNVFYAEQAPLPGSPGHTLRAKVTVISLADFRRRCSHRRFESYIWGRFAQPTHIVAARDEATRAQVETALLTAAGTLLREALPALPASGEVTALWEQALGLSYATELRTERSGRAGELARGNSAFYLDLTRHHAGKLGFPLHLEQRGDSCHYRSEIGPWRRRRAAVAWTLRRILGKFMSILRVVKGLFTFEGGLDYIAWKLERHSGEEIVIPDKVRRRPLVHLWGFFWELYRRGIFK